jgi:uncharacterized protein (TIGR02646 family)
MRCVKIFEDAKPYKRWLKDADNLTEDLKRATSEEERQKIIEDNENLWQRKKFKEWLISLFHKKCWYTESKENVSAYHVDHFRPKGRVAEESETHEGYWWLAFVWQNYRVAGQLINVKKKDKFPVNGTFRATIEDTRLENEDALLIDPLEEEDVALLSFEASGEVVYAEPISDDDKKRVDATREILGLNKIPNLVEARQQKWQRCLDYINQYVKADTLNNPLRKVHKSFAKFELNKMIKEEEEFSAVALACLRKKAPEPLQNQIFC